MTDSRAPWAWLGPGFSPAGDEAVVVEDLREVGRLELSAQTSPADRHAPLRLAETARGSLGPDERLLLLLGYDASCAFAGLAHHRAAGALGPDLWIGVGRARPAPLPPSSDEARGLDLRIPAGARANHEAAVARCLEAIYDGVCYQANLAHPLEVAPRTAREARAWLRAQVARQAPDFAALLPLPGFGDLVSLSPERFLRFDLDEGWVRTYPVKGTAPRGGSPEEDEANALALEASSKDRAEHMMIVDLLRNDLARVSTQVTVEALCARLTVSNVFHLESTIHGALEPGTSLSELLEKTAPGGSITGAPKSSACEMIAELEGRPRGPYTGTLVVIDGEGRGASSILIRTWIRPEGGPGLLHVGGGVVADSSPAGEWEETLAKARAFGEPTGEP